MTVSENTGKFSPDYFRFNHEAFMAFPHNGLVTAQRMIGEIEGTGFGYKLSADLLKVEVGREGIALISMKDLLQRLNELNIKQVDAVRLIALRDLNHVNIDFSGLSTFVDRVVVATNLLPMPVANTSAGGRLDYYLYANPEQFIEKLRRLRWIGHFQE